MSKVGTRFKKLKEDFEKNPLKTIGDTYVDTHKLMYKGIKEGISSVLSKKKKEKKRPHLPDKNQPTIKKPSPKLVGVKVKKKGVIRKNKLKMTKKKGVIKKKDYLEKRRTYKYTPQSKR